MSHRQLFASGETIREQKDEIAGLQAEIERLRLTDEEREAIVACLRSLERALWADPDNLGGQHRELQRDAATLHRLLERLASTNGAEVSR